MKAMTLGLGLTVLPMALLLMGIFGVLLLVMFLPGIGGNSANSLNMSLAGNVVPPTGNGSLPISELVQLAHQAGIPNDQLATAVAIAEAESSGRPNATNVNSNGSTDRGLWQINNFAHPNVSNAQAFNPLGNAEAMASISNGGTDWTPWMTYDHGNYLSFLPEAEQAVAGAGY